MRGKISLADALSWKNFLPLRTYTDMLKYMAIPAATDWRYIFWFVEDLQVLDSSTESYRLSLHVNESAPVNYKKTEYSLLVISCLTAWSHYNMLVEEKMHTHHWNEIQRLFSRGPAGGRLRSSSAPLFLEKISSYSLGSKKSSSIPEFGAAPSDTALSGFVWSWSTISRCLTQFSSGGMICVHSWLQKLSKKRGCRPSCR